MRTGRTDKTAHDSTKLQKKVLEVAEAHSWPEEDWTNNKVQVKISEKNPAVFVAAYASSNNEKDGADLAAIVKKQVEQAMKLGARDL